MTSYEGIEVLLRDSTVWRFLRDQTRMSRKDGQLSNASPDLFVDILSFDSLMLQQLQLPDL